MSPSYLRGRGLRAYRSSLDQRRECSIADMVVDTVPESEKPEIKIPRVLSFRSSCIFSPIRQLHSRSGSRGPRIAGDLKNVHMYDALSFIQCISILSHFFVFFPKAQKNPEVVMGCFDRGGAIVRISLDHSLRNHILLSLFTWDSLQFLLSTSRLRRFRCAMYWLSIDKR